MIHEQKTKLIIFLLIAATGVIILSFSLSNMIFLPAKLISINISKPELFQSDESASSVNYIPNNLKNTLFLFIFLIPIITIIIYKIKTQKKWKELLNVLIYGLLFVAGIGAIISLIFLLHPQITASPIPAESLRTDRVHRSAQIAPLPPVFVFMIGLLLISLVIILITKFFYKENRNKSIDQKIQQKTQDARKAVLHGKNFNETIINYYKEMCRIVDKEENIHRLDSMTTGEFENKLVQLGFPKNPIHALTVIFEKARYGNTEILTLERKSALQSFDSIIDYLKTKRGPNES